MAKEKKLEDNNKVGMFEYSEMANQMIEQRKKEFNDLQHNYLLATVALKTTQEQIAKERVAFEQLKKSEELNRNKVLQAREQELDAKYHALDINKANFDKRSVELKTREVAIAHLFDERNKMNADRIDIERLRSKAEELMSQATKKVAEAQSIFNTSRQKEEEAKQALEKANQLNQSVSAREISQKNELADLISRTNNLNEVRKAVEPKLKELDLMEKNIKVKEEDLEKREREVTRKLEEDRSIVIAFSDREKKLKSRESEVAMREQEVARKLLLIGDGK